MASLIETNAELRLERCAEEETEGNNSARIKVIIDIQWWATEWLWKVALKGSISFKQKMIERETLFLAISVKFRFKLSRLSSSLPYIPLDLVLPVTGNLESPPFFKHSHPENNRLEG